MKKISIVFLIFIFTVTVICCSCKKTDNKIVVKPRPVKVLELKEETYPVTINYLGTVMAKETKEYSFKFSGKISNIFVEEGQKIGKEELLAELDTYDASLALNAAEENLKKAQSNYDFVKVTYERIKALYEIEALPKQDYDEIKMKLIMAEAELHKAQVDSSNKQNAIVDSNIFSDVDGYVVKVLKQESEIASAGYPVIVVRSDEKMILVGISVEDVEKICFDMLTEINVNVKRVKGKIATIAQVPDMETRTYAVEIDLTTENDDVPLGSFAEVEFEINKEEGILIPINSIISNGEDFVYIVSKENRAEKRNISLRKIVGNRVLIKGLSANEKLVIEGMKSLQQGNLVTIIN